MENRLFSLERITFDEGGLQRVKLAALAESLDRLDVAPVHERCE